MRRFVFHSIFILTAITILYSCSPTKNTALRRFYNNLVSRYNIYFNGSEAMQQGVLQLVNNHKDDFSGIISLFPYGTQQEADAVRPLMDRAYEKGSKVIINRSMLFRGVEYNNWVDDSYLLIGKSYFFKKEFIAANEVFDFISRNFPKNKLRFDAQLWLAKSNIFYGRPQRADAILVNLEPFVNKGETSKEVRSMFPIVKAYLLIKTDRLKPASEYLEKALKEKQNRRTRIRLNFVAGQVNQRLGENQKAIDFYLRTLRLAPPYELAFNARLFAAECYDTSLGKNDNIIAELFKMIKDSKNKDYLDRIYYALANIELKKGNNDKAIEYLKLSASSSTVNNIQKGFTYKKLSELFFSLQKYQETKIYLDSTIAFLPKEHEQFKSIEEKSKILTDLVANLHTIQLQDSLVKLARMSERERNAVIDNLITEHIQQEELRKEEERKKELAALLESNQRGQAPTTLPSNVWYFYNPSAVSFGKSEFTRTWGTRKLEDLWRLRVKDMQNFETADGTQKNEESGDTTALSLEQKDPRDRAFYIKDIPKTEEDINIALEKVEEAHYRAAVIYKQDLKDLPPAIELFETLLSRFPNTEFKLQTYYNLYLIFDNLKQNDSKQKYAQLITANFPESSFAKIINDPDYFKNLEKQADEVNLLYTETYNAFINNNCNLVIRNSNLALEKYSNPEMLVKFEFLKAKCLGRTKGRDSYIAQLEHILANYPESNVTALARLNLNFFTEKDSISESKGKESDTNIVKTQATQSIYTVSPSSFHLFLLLVDLKTSNIVAIREAISDFNKDAFPLSNLSVNSLFLTSTRQMVTVSRFNNQDEAIKYLRLIQNYNNLNTLTANTNPVLVVITAENYPIFFKDKNEKTYLDFFLENYINKF